MSASPNAEASINDVLTTLDYRLRDLRGLWIGAIVLAAADLLAGALFIAPTWDDLGSAAPFGLGLVFLDGFQVMVVAIGATSGHRVSSTATRDMAAVLARHEAHGIDLQRIGAERAAQLSALTEQVTSLTGQVTILTEQVTGLRQILAGGADELQAHRAHYRDTR